MLTAAQVSRLTDSELLHYLEDRRHNSIIINTLCNRLSILLEVKDEDKHANVLIAEDNVNHSVECPVCHAQLFADYDISNNLFEVKIEK